MRNFFPGLNLVQKVTTTMIVLFVITNISLALIISQLIRQSYLNEQKRSISQFVLKQAAQYLEAANLQETDLKVLPEKFDTFRNNISTSDVAEVTIFNTGGIVLSADDPTLTGKQLPADSLNRLARVFEGTTTTTINQALLGGQDLNNRRLLRIYVPLIFDDVNVVGVVEIAIRLASLNSEIARSQVYVLAIMTTIISLAFVILYIIIRQASLTLVKQDQQLRLDVQKEQAYSKLKSDFIALASHQLRTPATTILWNLEELQGDKNNQLNPEQKDLSSSAHQAAQTLVAIVNNLLVVADIKPDYFSLEAESYLLEDLIRQIVDKNKLYLPEKRQKTLFQITAYGTALNLKRSALSLVIESIYKNALDYSPADSIITITLSSQPNAAVIDIIDNGIGIPFEERNKVFGQFFRASNAIEQKNAGSGLSLYIAYKVVVGYGGILQYTPLETGSKFTISIPLKYSN